MAGIDEQHLRNERMHDQNVSADHAQPFSIETNNSTTTATATTTTDHPVLGHEQPRNTEDQRDQTIPSAPTDTTSEIQEQFAGAFIRPPHSGEILNNHHALSDTQQQQQQHHHNHRGEPIIDLSDQTKTAQAAMAQPSHESQLENVNIGSQPLSQEQQLHHQQDHQHQPQQLPLNNELIAQQNGQIEMLPQLHVQQPVPPHLLTQLQGGIPPHIGVFEQPAKMETDFNNLKLIPDPPGLAQWREKLFNVEDTIVLSEEEYATFHLLLLLIFTNVPCNNPSRDSV